MLGEGMINSMFPSPRLHSNVFVTFVLFVCGGPIAGCAIVGPLSIDHGRTSYNEVIADTARQQTLLNLVRVEEGETPLFMDVTEVDAATLATASISGGPSGLGSIPNYKSTSAGTIEGAVGAVTGSASYQEAPTVRYFPLSGQPLIQQVSTPLTPESIASLHDSDWSLAAILDLGVARITKKYEYYDAVIDAIIDLDNYGALIIAATSPPKPGNTITLSGLTITSNEQQSKDDLTLFGVLLSPDTYEDIATCDGKTPQEAAKIIKVLWTRLLHYTGTKIPMVTESDPVQITIPILPNYISIPSKARIRSVTREERPSVLIRPASSSTRASSSIVAEPPLLTTRSALGIMKAATQLRPSIAFLPLSTVRSIIDDYYSPSRSKLCREPFYTLDPLIYPPNPFSHGGSSGPTPAEENVHKALADPKRLGLATMYTDKALLTPDELADEQALGGARRFMLVAYSDDPPDDAFVTLNHGGQWYSILRRDTVSMDTLALITEFNTIQAIPGQSPPLTPTISVGARQ
jgi:hypothetical protein